MITVPGIDRVISGEMKLPKPARIGFLTNYAARTRDGRWSGQAIPAAGYDVVCFLGPEHGLSASAPAGADVPHAQGGSIPVLSMYGADQSAVKSAVAGIDLILVDLQDVGCRYYTYNWTIRELMRMAADYGKAVVILDRPNPLGGDVIEGNLPDATDSPVCASAVPVRHGLTIGELALYNRRYFEIDVDLSVVPMRSWNRHMQWSATGLAFIPPSPNLRSPNALVLYPGTCLIEGTNVSEGRGTDAPFQVIGAPFVNAELLARALSGVEAGTLAFVPTESKWEGENCRGVKIRVPRSHAARSVELGLTLVTTLSVMPRFQFRPPFFDALAGTCAWRGRIERGESAGEIAAGWREDEARFQADREDLLLY